METVKNKFSKLVTGSLTFILFFVAIPSFKDPLHWDEHFTSLLSTDVSVKEMILLPTDREKKFDILDYRPNPYQTLPNLFVLGVVKLDLFSKSNIRLGSLLVFLIFLMTLYRFSLVYLSPITTVIIYGNLITNSTFQWFIFPSRGYSYGMTFCLLFLYFTLLFIDKNKKSGNKSLYVAGFAMLMALLSHNLAGLFCILVISVIILCVVKEYYSGRILDEAKRKLILVGSILSPIALFFLYLHMSHLDELGDLDKKEVGFFGQALLRGFGIFEGSFDFVIFIIAAIFVVVSIKNRTENFLNSILFKLFCLICCFWFLVYFVIGADVAYGRYLLFFLLPIMMMFGEAIWVETNKFLKQFLSILAIFIFVLMPFLNSQELHIHLYNRDIMHGFGSFIEKVKNDILDSEQDCIDLHGESKIEIVLAKKLYFERFKDDDCRRTYHVVLGRGNLLLDKPPIYEKDGRLVFIK